MANEMWLRNKLCASPPGGGKNGRENRICATPFHEGLIARNGGFRIVSAKP